MNDNSKLQCSNLQAGHHCHSLIIVHSSATTNRLWNDHRFPSLHYYGLHRYVYIIFTVWYPDPVGLQCPSLLHVSYQLLHLWQFCTYTLPCDLCKAHTTRTSAYQVFFAKPVPVIHVVVIHCTVCLWTHWGTILQSAFMNSPVYCGHSMTLCLLHSR